MSASAEFVRKRAVLERRNTSKESASTAREDYPNETCGAMLGVDGESGARGAGAVSADQSPRRFAAQPLFGDRRGRARAPSAPRPSRAWS